MDTHDLSASGLRRWLTRGPAHVCYMTDDGRLLTSFYGFSSKEAVERVTGRQAQVISPIKGPKPARDNRLFSSKTTDPVGHWLDTELRLWSPEQVAWLIEQVLLKMAPLHRTGLAHGALTAWRIGYTEDTVHMMDQGVMAAACHASEDGFGLNTPGFHDLFRSGDPLPPEVIKGQTATPRSDVFSLAAVALKLLTGKDAFGHDEKLNRLRRMVRGDHILAETAECGILSQWLNRSLSSEIEERPTPATLLTLLGGLEKEIPTRSDTATPFSDHFKGRDIPDQLPAALWPDTRIRERLRIADLQLNMWRASKRHPKQRQRTWRWLALLSATLGTFIVISMVVDTLDTARFDSRPGPTLRRPSVKATTSPITVLPRRRGATFERHPRHGPEPTEF